MTPKTRSAAGKAVSPREAVSPPETEAETMVTFYDEIAPELHEFIATQSIFFVGSAALHLPHSHVNVSPKGYADSTFTVANPKSVWYQDATGSGIPPITSVLMYRYRDDFTFI
jgi:hypothetical protein